MPELDPRSAAGYRQLRFGTVADYLAELDRILQADAAGRAVPLGNWTLGQIFAHLAAWIEYGYDGFPPEVPAPPLPVRLMLRLVRGRFLRGRLPRGFRIPKVPRGTVGQDDAPTREAAARLRRALQRIEHEPYRHPSPAFGRLTLQQQVLLTLRHGELHLGYVSR